MSLILRHFSLESGIFGSLSQQEKKTSVINNEDDSCQASVLVKYLDVGNKEG